MYATVYALYYILTCITINPFKAQKQYASDDIKIVCLVQLTFWNSLPPEIVHQINLLTLKML